MRESLITILILRIRNYIMRELLITILILQMMVISFYFNDLRQIAKIKLCKDNPTLVINNKIRSDCNCKELLKKYNIEIKGE